MDHIIPRTGLFCLDNFSCGPSVSRATTTAAAEAVVQRRYSVRLVQQYSSKKVVTYLREYVYKYHMMTFDIR